MAAKTKILKSAKSGLGKNLKLNLSPIELKLEKKQEETKKEQKPEEQKSKEDEEKNLSPKFQQFSEGLSPHSRGFIPPAIKEEVSATENLEKFAESQPTSSKAKEAISEARPGYISRGSSYAEGYSPSSKYSSEERAGYDSSSRKTESFTPRIPDTASGGLRQSPLLASERLAPSFVSPSARESAKYQSAETAELEEFARQQEQYLIKKEQEKKLPFRRSSIRPIR